MDCSSCHRFIRTHRVLLRRLLIAGALALAFGALGAASPARPAAGDCKVFYS
jgi:hypothetical protein